MVAVFSSALPTHSIRFTSSVLLHSRFGVCVEVYSLADSSAFGRRARLRQTAADFGYGRFALASNGRAVRCRPASGRVWFWLLQNSGTGLHDRRWSGCCQNVQLLPSLRPVAAGCLCWHIADQRPHGGMAGGDAGEVPKARGGEPQIFLSVRGGQ